MPTENRSSNTEMVSLSRDLIDLTLAHLPNDSAAKWEIYDLLAQPTPQPHQDPIARMVGTAFWWTKEEAERDAAETGLPIVGLGAMVDPVVAERLRTATAFVQRMVDCAGTKPSVATGYLRDILDVLKGSDQYTREGRRR